MKKSLRTLLDHIPGLAKNIVFGKKKKNENLQRTHNLDEGKLSL